jgi:predicted DNA-binding protein (MmcQ/YjbR family)
MNERPTFGDMHQDFADRVCHGLDGTERQEPFGPGTVVWTVAGHMFAAYTEDGHGLSLRLECGHATRLVEEGRASSPPWLTGEGWVMIPWEMTHPEELRRRIEASYGLVRMDRNAEMRH